MSAFVKEYLNQTFQDYVKTVRFHCACKMIMNGKDTMQNVCVESGFSDYRYFSERFRQRTGMTPEQYSHHPRFIWMLSRRITAFIPWNISIPAARALNWWKGTRRRSFDQIVNLSNRLPLIRQGKRLHNSIY
jgi:hypothetical protein